MLWKGFQRPRHLEMDDEISNDTYGRFFAQPFERGFGTTVGNAMRRVLERAQEHVARTVQTLDTLSPLATLARGYAILENPATGALVRAAGEVQPGDAVRARLARGLLDCRVEKVRNDA